MADTFSRLPTVRAGTGCLSDSTATASTRHDSFDRLRAIRGTAAWSLVSIQALHRFYRAGSNEIVAASWMTREDRELMIADNISYVNGVLDAVERECQPAADDRVRRVLAGREHGVPGGDAWFTPGAAASLRWVETFRVPPELTELGVGEGRTGTRWARSSRPFLHGRYQETRTCVASRLPAFRSSASTSMPNTSGPRRSRGRRPTGSTISHDRRHPFDCRSPHFVIDRRATLGICTGDLE